MNIKYTATFKPEIRRSTPKDLNSPLISENVPLMIDLTFAGQRVWITTGYRIDFKIWDGINQKATGKTSKGLTAKEINAAIGSAKEKIKKIFKAFEVSEKTPTKEEFLFSFRGDKKKVSTKQTQTFFTIYNQFLKERSAKSEWTPSTVVKFENIRSKLLEFDKDLTFEKANKEETLQAFIVFLRDKKELRNTTIAKQIRFVKTYLKWAYDKDITPNNDYKKFTPSLKGTDGKNKTVIFLSPEEFLQLYNFDAKKEHLNHVKDVFCFCCLTGLRYSDVFKLQRSEIKTDFIQFTTQKTDHTLKVELNDKSRAILDKYKAIPFENNKALPVISNQKANEHLKTLLKMAEINEPVNISYYKGGARINETHPKYAVVGTHTARRTFVCLSLYLGIKAEVIMKWTGHSSHTTMKPYVDVMDKFKEIEMKKFNF